MKNRLYVKGRIVHKRRFKKSKEISKWLDGGDEVINDDNREDFNVRIKKLTEKN